MISFTITKVFFISPASNANGVISKPKLLSVEVLYEKFLARFNNKNDVILYFSGLQQII